MNIIAVDDEQFALTGLKLAIEETIPNGTVACFNKSRAALEYAKNNPIDIAFLDIEMGGMNGLQLAKSLKDIAASRGGAANSGAANSGGKTHIIFVTGYSQYAVDAFDLRASGYILKPVTVKAVSKEFEHYKALGLQVEELLTESLPVSEKRMRVQTFGNFEVFTDGKPLTFARTKTKELFAYLISRQGAKCNNNEIAAVLWEDKEDTPGLQSMYRHLVKDLTQVLNDAGIKDVLIKERGYLAIMPENISCDFFDFCAGKNVNNYMGEFMTQYGWAEFTNQFLYKKYNK